MDPEELAALGLGPPAARAADIPGLGPPIEDEETQQHTTRVMDLGTMDVHTGEATGEPSIASSEEVAPPKEDIHKYRPVMVPIEEAEQMRAEGAEIIGRDPVAGMARVIPHEQRVAMMRSRGIQIGRTRPTDFDVTEVPPAIRSAIQAAVPFTGGVVGPALAVAGVDVAPRTVSPQGVAMGAGQALTLGTMDEIGEAMGATGGREALEVAQQTDPGGVGVGQALGTLPWLIAPGAGEVAAARGVGTVGRIAATAGEGAAIGAAGSYGAGQDPATGAIGGALFGGGLAAGGAALSRTGAVGAQQAALDARRHARAATLNALSAQIQAAPGRAPKRYMDQLARLADNSDDIVGELRDLGVRSADHAEAIQARAGESLGDIAQQVDDVAEASFNAGRVGDRLRELAHTVRSRPGQASQRAAEALEREAQDWVGSSGFRQAWEARQTLNNPSIWRDNEGYLGPAKEHARALYRVISDELEGAIGATRPELLDAWRSHSRAYSITSPIVRGAGEAAVRSAKNKGLLWMLGSMAAGSILGGGEELGARQVGTAAGTLALGALAHRAPAVRARYHQIAAHLASTRPQALGRFAATLQQAATKGPRAVAAAHFALWQREPEYRTALREQAGEESDDAR